MSVLCIAILVLCVSSASAQNGDTHVGESDDTPMETASVETATEDAPAPRTIERRDVPDYDGRGEEPRDPARGLLWIPRIIASPLFFIAEYVLRRPLEYVVTSVEEQEIAGRVLRFFQFGPDNRFFLSPSATFDLGIRPNIGLYFGVDDAFVDGNAVRVNYSFGGLGWHLAAISNRYVWGESNEWEFAVRSRFMQRPDGRYWGVGTGVREELDSAYSFLGSDTEIYLERRFGRANRIRLHTDIRFRSFGEDVGDTGDRPTVPERALQSMEGLPPGYAEGYTVHVVGAQLELDSRRDRPNPGSGVQAMFDAEFAYSLRDPSQSMWVNYGASVVGFLDVSGTNHIFSLALSARLTDAIHGDVPFVQQAVLSGGGPMSGFLGLFLTGPSALSATLTYSWPIWVFLDGIAHVAVGNVFDERFGGAALNKMRLSTGIGIAAVSKRDHFFEFLVGFGTDTFENGARVDSVRLVIGARREF